MKFFLDNWMLFALAAASGALLFWPLLRNVSVAGAVGTAEAVRLINREKGVLVDVSEPADFAAGHAAGARNVPLGQIEGSKLLPGNKTLPILLLCANGSRSGKAAVLLRKLGHEKATPVAGGTAGWREASLPIERSVDKSAEKSAEKAA